MSQSRNIIRGAGSSRALRRRIMRRGVGGTVKRGTARRWNAVRRIREAFEHDGWSV